MKRSKVPTMYNKLAHKVRYHAITGIHVHTNSSDVILFNLLSLLTILNEDIYERPCPKSKLRL